MSAAAPLGDRRRRRRTGVGITAAVVLLVGTVVAVLLIPGTGDRARSAATPSTSPTVVTAPPASFLRPGQVDPHYARNAAAAAAVFRGLPVLHGAIRHTRAPDAVLRSAQAVPGTGARVVLLVGWWTWHGTRVAALHDFARLRSATLEPGGLSGPISGVQTNWFYGPSTAATAELVVGFSTLVVPHGVAIREEVFATPRPSRTLDSFVQAPTAVVARYEVDHEGAGGGRPSVATRTLQGALARELADQVNALGTHAVFAPSCGPVLADRVTATLTFRTRRGTFTVAAGGCFMLTLTSASGTRYFLEEGTVAAHVRTVLGLPENWGTR